MSTESQDYKIVLGVIGADCHAVGNRILTSVLTQGGIDVVNLGVMVAQDEFIEAALSEQAGAILVSSIYGHGELDCQDFRARCEERGLTDIVLYVGGNLVIGKQEFSVVEAQFREMGFDRVFHPSADLQEVIGLLKADIDANRPAQLARNSRPLADERLGLSA
ncbi:methylaspartate mutase subunit S (plasmid) [Gemmobacter fulvus]|uniref:Glutamate mutase sigma subunit n=1 Tax=Gemmobacter fulvus TaxID=2840474 RepID=A0A975S3S4_9RHOB|nr:methylaspartate mutase subunit S [Gemmobacter fulvus]MBT9246635.1 methylaspartate mutase subunit S [Gemmobacter fulvus]QWK92721.1 methylaspartate mutase subunit S [Gemmobacter fulvus]